MREKGSPGVGAKLPVAQVASRLVVVEELTVV